MHKPFLLLVASVCVVVLVGCDEEQFDHVPAAGMGTLIIDNDTTDDIDIFVDGLLLGQVDDYDDSYTDMMPGVYRIVLADEDGHRSYREYLDILPGRLTILHVDDTSTWGDYSVWVEFRD